MRSQPLPRPFHLANEGLALLLEPVMLAALAWWGAEAGGSPTGRVLPGVAAPLAAAVIWGLCAAPRARFRLPM
ncbi:MAG TPA: hypothetical protein DEH11_18225, partial [Actinobacteria bacterium]|nr:hypothetical protein [Actinomycetota bacterium]